MSDRINGLAAVIRQHPNNIPTPTLSVAVANFLAVDQYDGYAAAIGDLIDRANPNRTMGAAALAETILQELDPDGDER